ncbi:MAG: XRE family transcriptional regulator [Mesorhizobium sp.]|uniref:helix-turn-helix domain-containing protein n=1 Tax=Mesorhizobium sp. TaxID=1871066 RepID=UPI000FE3BC0D|nr:XRE family transcriptional regulator [Mesorhizobium sp.]RWA73987.1 MAG: XRE family transcriptional regulator [Mesorhizobium sp.]RWC05209.1 MAG: XRE family transcriptional regulator [Mesorhizobium sp.]RWG86635.1 MAG: XRE family transcriptional regulator [Mesorhizobium sp.]RWK09623.1 MAG: XRE family transcriptional regulator [Mesorhizobium sp.]RWK13217.1 MAG: XRE family transcriptional regulator [Mesorhizobium sp.]
MSTPVPLHQSRPVGFPRSGAVAGKRAVSIQLCQDPHAVRAPSENELQVAIGREVRACRKCHGMTVTELASAANISVGMMSKIENGVISASLTMLQALSQALGVPMTSLLRSFEEERSAVFVKAGAGIGVERRGTRAGDQYNLLGYIGSSSSAVSVEPYLITLASDTDAFPLLQHPGMELLYLLEGEITYRHGSTLYHMMPGDSLFFDADTPHGPVHLKRLPIRFLSIISYQQRW